MYTYDLQPRGPQLFSLCCFNAAAYCSLFGLDSQSMSSFRRYLDRAQDVPRVPDLSGYYALPHVPDPSVHPSFEALFQDTWSVSKGK